MSAQSKDADYDHLAKIVLSYHDGLNRGEAEISLAALSDNLFMMNGNYSDDPVEWQAHLYLSGEEVNEWLDNMIEHASPHNNRIRFLDFDVRQNSALIITEETGSNKFRSWNDELVVYFLGQADKEWKIVSLYIRDAKNPD